MSNNIVTQNSFYQTTDLALATAISLWYPIESLDKSNVRQSVFRFKREESLDQLVEAYWRGELQVEPQSYFNQLRVLKARLYARE